MCAGRATPAPGYTRHSISRRLSTIFTACTCSDGQADSSGFEHVFVGELDEGHVKGLHNWIQTMVEESRGNLDYMGFVLPRHHHQSRDVEGVDGPRELLSIQLGWEVRAAHCTRPTLYAHVALPACGRSSRRGLPLRVHELEPRGRASGSGPGTRRF